MAAIAFLLMQHMFTKLYLMALVTLLTYLLTYLLILFLHICIMIFQDYDDLSRSIMIMSVPCLLSVFEFLISLTFNGIYRFSSNDLKRIGAECICIKTVN